LVAGLPAVITSQSGIKSFLSLPYGAYGSALFKSNIDEKSKKELWDYFTNYLNDNSFSFIELVDYDGLLANIDLPRFEKVNCFTHIIELGNAESYKPARDRVERHIRSGLKKQVDINQIDDVGLIEKFYNLYEQTEKRHGRSKPMYGKKFFQVLFDRLSISTALYWLAAYHEGQMIGSQINFIHGDALYYWQGVMDFEKREMKQAYLLMHNSINHAIGLDLRWVNLGASPPDAEGLIDYKESWGAVRRDYSIYRRKSFLHRVLGR